VGLKHSVFSNFTVQIPPFSRTPRGFEASPTPTSSRIVHKLSAEPLVGLKLLFLALTQLTAKLSAEPLVGLKRLADDQDADHRHFQPNPSWV